jgi:hypothetical protein
VNRDSSSVAPAVAVTLQSARCWWVSGSTNPSPSQQALPYLSKAQESNSVRRLMSSPRATPSQSRWLRYSSASPSPASARSQPSARCFSGSTVAAATILVVLVLQSTVFLMDRQFQGMIMNSQIFFCGATKAGSEKGWDNSTAGAAHGRNNSVNVDPPTTDKSMLRPKADSDRPYPQQEKPSGLTHPEIGYSASSPTTFDGVQARAFQRWNASLPLPCDEPEPNWRKMHKEPTTTGFIFAKPYKTGSSTASGVNLRIARNVARRLGKGGSNQTAWEMCKSRSDHVPVSSVYAGRDRNRSYLWTVVRDPTARLVSQFFHFHIAREKHEPTDAIFREYALNGPTVLIHDYYYFALSMGGFNKDRDDRRRLANDIINDYDFIGTTERMDESFVVMSMLLGVPVSDVTYLKAKGHGGFDDGGGRPEGEICTYIWPSFVSPGMKEFLDSDLWKNISYWDRVLHQAADRSLDLTIDRLGRDKVAANVALYQELQERSREACLHKTTFPCSEGGQHSWVTDCIWRDSGCGGECLDEVSDSFGA